MSRGAPPAGAGANRPDGKRLRSTQKKSGPAGLLLGFDVRALLGTDIELAGASGDADCVQGALVLGCSF